MGQMRMRIKPIVIFNLKSEQGFTLLELITVLAIASVLFSLMTGVLVQAGSFYHFFIEDSPVAGETMIIINKISREISRATEIEVEDNILTMKLYVSSGEEDPEQHWIRYRTYESSRGTELGFQREVSQVGEEIEFTRIDSVLGNIADFSVGLIPRELIKISICRASASGKTISKQQTVYAKKGESR